MTKSNYNPTTPINQADVKSIMPLLKEDITFLAGVLRCTINLENKLKMRESLELCIDMLRGM
jgi:hypothetical protein